MQLKRSNCTTRIAKTVSVLAIFFCHAIGAQQVIDLASDRAPQAIVHILQSNLGDNSDSRELRLMNMALDSAATPVVHLDLHHITGSVTEKTKIIFGGNGEMSPEKVIVDEIYVGKINGQPDIPAFVSTDESHKKYP